MIQAHLRRLGGRIDAMSMRERALVFGCALIATLLGWYQFAALPAMADARRTVEEIRAARARIDAADQAVRSQAAALSVDAGASLAEQIDQAQRRAAEIERLIEARAREIVDPATMAKVLEDLLATQAGLDLVRAHNLKARNLAERDGDAPLYRHTLRLELEGPYLAVLDYLEKVEALPWRMFWQAIEIDAREFPRNRVRIDVSTLSFEEDWIGV